MAAGLEVTKDVEPFSIVRGVPAKYIIMRFVDDDIQKHQQMFKLPDSYFENFEPLLLREKEK